MKVEPNVNRLAYNVRHLAAALDLSEQMIRRAITAKELPATKVGRRLLIRASDVDRFLAKKAVV